VMVLVVGVWCRGVGSLVVEFWEGRRFLVDCEVWSDYYFVAS
jgi:hypothetical protein